jgi:hypothetical protein
MAETTARAHLRFVDAKRLGGWATSLEGVGIMSVKDEMLGGLDGLLVGEDERPHYLVIASTGEPKQRYLLPVGVAWFDETTGVIRTDVDARNLTGCPAFDVKSYDEMSAEQAWEYERRVLRACCPETLAAPGGRLDYYNRLPQFRPGDWLKRK